MKRAPPTAASHDLLTAERPRRMQRRSDGMLATKLSNAKQEAEELGGLLDAAVTDLRIAAAMTHGSVADSRAGMIAVSSLPAAGFVRKRWDGPESELLFGSDSHTSPAPSSPALVDVSSVRSHFHEATSQLLSSLDWSHVCVAGGAVLSCLLPVGEYPSNAGGDVDLFLHGLDAAAAVRKVSFPSSHSPVLHRALTPTYFCR